LDYAFEGWNHPDAGTSKVLSQQFPCMTLRPPEAFRFSVHNQISLVSLEWDCCLRFIIDSISVIAQVVAERPSLGVFVVPRLLPRNIFTVSVASVKEASRSPMNSPLIT